MPESFIRPWLSLGEAQMILHSLDEEEGAERAIEIASDWLEEEDGERVYTVEEMLAIQAKERGQLTPEEAYVLVHGVVGPADTPEEVLDAAEALHDQAMGKLRALAALKAPDA